MQDEELLRRIASGAESALNTLMERHGARFLSFFDRYLGDRAGAEDLVVELFVRIWRNAGRFDAERGKATSWMFRIASNLAASAVRSRTRRIYREAGVDPEWPSRNGALSGDPLETLARAESAAKLRTALGALPETIRAVVLLRHFHDLSFAEVGEALDIPTGTAKSRMHRGLLLLRNELQPEATP